MSARLSIERAQAMGALYRLKLALDDLERATAERNLPAARYLLDTEIAEAMQAIDLAGIADDGMVEDLTDAIEAVRFELKRNPK